MKSLILLRHAKSSWKEKGLRDHDRPLNTRGRRDAPRAGSALRGANLAPDLIISSSAERAIRTAEQVARAIDFEGYIAVDRRLYLASADEILEIVRRIAEHDPKAACVMLVGHNPGMEEFVEAMVDEVVPVPTAAIIELKLGIDSWSKASFERGAELGFRWKPKDEDR